MPILPTDKPPKPKQDPVNHPENTIINIPWKQRI